MPAPASGAPLAGMRVLEFGQIAAGPFAGSLFADLGADVVKVERSDGGDGMRSWPPLLENAAGEPYSGNFASLNRNKRSFAADLKDPDDLSAVRGLCERADVLIENFRPGVMKRLGLDYEALRETNPKLVYCSISGYGQEGPNALRGAFDVTVQAASGIMSCTGEPDGQPVKVGVPVGDFSAGLYAAYTVMAALHRGEGGYIDCSMVGSLLGMAALQTSEYFGTGKPAGRLGSAHPRNAPYQAFAASDRDFVIAAGNDGLWRKVCEVVEWPELADDPRFVVQTLRARDQRELAELLAPIFARRTAAEWLEKLDEQGVPCALIKDFAEALDDPQVRSMDIVSEVELGNGVKLDAVDLPIKISDFEFEVFQRPPLLGEHNDEVLDEWSDPVARAG